MNTRIKPLAVAALLFTVAANAAHSQSYATGYDPANTYDLSRTTGFNDPTAATGQPTTLDNGGGGYFYHASLVQSAYGYDAATNAPLLTSLGSDGAGALTLTFATPIVHSDQHYFGQDFTVYSNSFFTGTNTSTGQGYVNEGDDLSQYLLDGGMFGHLPTVSVSADGKNFVTVQTADTLVFAENPYHWDGLSSSNTSGFGALQDFSKPVNPALSAANFKGVSAADAINTLYNGSAGGVSFSLTGTGLSQISYVRFTGTGNIDAVSAVGFAPVPEPTPWVIFAIGTVLLTARRRFRTSN